MYIRRPKIRIQAWIFLLVAVAVLLLLNSPWFLKKTVYPIPYQDQIFYYTGIWGIDPYLATAVMRVESHFDEKAESSKGARGLMQIMPETGQWAAEQIKLKDYKPTQLYDPERNIQIGCWYLAQLAHEFQGNQLLMITAYNAGPTKVKTWLSTGQWDGRWETIENIPFLETRDYVRKVITDYQVYRRLYTGSRDG